MIPGLDMELLRLENAQEQKLRELEERVDQLSSQISQVLHEILNLREGKPYGSRE